MKTTNKNLRSVLTRAILTLALAAGVVTMNTGCDDEAVYEVLETVADGFLFGLNNPELVLDGGGLDP